MQCHRSGLGCDGQLSAVSSPYAKCHARTVSDGLTDEQAAVRGGEKGEGGRDRMTGGKDVTQPPLLCSGIIG